MKRVNLLSRAEMKKVLREAEEDPNWGSIELDLPVDWVCCLPSFGLNAGILKSYIYVLHT